ncbi:MAG: zinc ribbon domain-containing protein [FCB group bacterium]|nr:zinc ribbon domain-containing protein [FCB group bacterium]
MKRILLLAIGVLLSGQANAKEFKEISVVIYPEYYYNGVMVEYSGEIDTTSLPLAVGFMVPAETDSVFSVHEKAGQGTRVVSEKVVKKGNESWVYLNIKEPSFRTFIFYVPFDPQNKQREFDYTVKFDKDLTDFHIAVQKPLKAENFELFPAGAESFKDQHGLEFFRFHIENLPVNQTKTVQVKYENPSGVTTIQVLQTMLSSSGKGSSESAALADGTPIRYRLPLWQPLAVLAIIAVIIGVIYRRYQGREPEPDAASAPREETTAGALFCPACGTRLKVGDNFCFKCGHKI